MKITLNSKNIASKFTFNTTTYALIKRQDCYVTSLVRRDYC